MAVSVDLAIDNPAPAHGQVVTVTYVVSGNEPVPAHDEPVTGSANVGGTNFPTLDTLTLPGSPAQEEAFTAPTCLGLTFVATANPAVFTAVVP